MILVHDRDKFNAYMAALWRDMDAAYLRSNTAWYLPENIAHTIPKFNFSNRLPLNVDLTEKSLEDLCIALTGSGMKLTHDQVQLYKTFYDGDIAVIEPTIGRSVLVYRPDSGSDQYETGQIQYVYNSNEIDVSMVTRDGRPLALTRIPLFHGLEGDKHPGPGEVHGPFACWMPYQRKQAVGKQPDPFAGRSF